VGFRLSNHPRLCLGWRFFRHGRGRRLPTKSKLLCQRRALGGIRRCRQWMIAVEPPSPPIFISAQAVADADVPSKRLTSITAVKAHHIVMAYRLSHGHSGHPYLLRRWCLPELTERPIYGCDKLR
jgi:hypothetical protein